VVKLLNLVSHLLRIVLYVILQAIAGWVPSYGMA